MVTRLVRRAVPMLEQLAAEHQAVVRRALAVQLGWFVAFIGALVLAVGLVAVLMLINAHRLDVRAKQASIATMQEALDEREDQLDRVVKDHAWSNEAVEAVQLHRDHSWAEARLGPYLHDAYRYDWAFIIAPNGSTFYAAHEGDPVADDITKALGNDQWRPLVERSRGVAEPEPQAVHAFLRMRDGGVGIGSVAAIMPETSWTGDRPAGTPYVLVVVRSLTPNLFSELATALGLSDLTFSLSTAPPETGLRLEGPDGKPVGSASWQTRRPGTEYVVALMPTFAAALVLLLAFIGLTWRVSRDQPK